MSHPYRLFTVPPPPPLGRAVDVKNIVAWLAAKDNVSVIAPRHYGKTVLLHAVAEAARAEKVFADVVLWDLRHFTPADDAEFFARFAEVLAEQLTMLGNEPREYFADAAARSATGVRLFFDGLHRRKLCVLVVMDGMDHPLSSQGVTRVTWNNLCGLSERNSIRIATGSRKRLRELCVSSDGRSSELWERFQKHLTLGAFTESELDGFLCPLKEIAGGLAGGARTEFRNWTGGIPLLSTGLAAALAESGEKNITAERVKAIAESALVAGNDWLAAVWDVCEPATQSAFAELLSVGELLADGNPEATRLTNLGLACRIGTMLRPACRFLGGFIAAQQAGLVSLKKLFGDAAAYEHNIRSVAALRWQQLSIGDDDLRAFITYALDAQANPKLFIAQIRNIFASALKLVWAVEAPNGSLPRFQSERALKQTQRFNYLLPSDPGPLLQCLELLTYKDGENGAKPKKVNRVIYTLLSSLKPAGDIGQHQAEHEVTPGFTAAVALTAVELARELSAAGLVTQSS